MDGWLSGIGDCLDAGLPPETFIFVPPLGFAKTVGGYDITAVDRFVDRLCVGAAAGSAIRWRDQDRAARDGPGSHGLQRRQYIRDCDAEWFRVSTLPGTRLRWTRAWPDEKVLSSDGQVLMTCRRKTKTWTLASGQELRKPGRGGEWVDAITGDTVLWVVGGHSYGYDYGAVLFPDQRWLRFPVQGAKLDNAVMTAINESGTTLLWFRRFDASRPLPPNALVNLGDSQKAAEVIVSPRCDVNPEILWVIALSASWLDAYFTAPVGGG